VTPPADSLAAPQAVAATAPPRRAALAFVFVTVLLDVLAFGIVIPVLPPLIESFLGGDTRGAAFWVGVFGTAYAAAQFLCSPVLGTLSDRYGRRPIFMMSNLGLGLDFVLMALVNTLPLLFLGRVISGVTAASITTAQAYIADVTPPEKRAAGYGMLGAAFGIGFVLGPALGGTLGELDPRLPFWVAAGLALANFCYGWLVLPESLPADKRSTRFDWRRANPVGALRLLREYERVLALAGIVFLSQLAHHALPATFVLYTGYRYDWGPQAVGLALALVGVFDVIVQGGLVRRVIPKIGERRAVLTGLSFGAAGMMWMALAPSGPWFLASIPMLAAWGFAKPAVQALITQRVPSDRQGRLQGSVQSLASLAGVFGPWTFAAVFASFIGADAIAYVPGAAFALASLVLLMAIALAWHAARPVATPAVAAAANPASPDGALH
jgi:DHA1 family tetracycline resistance protein-like MFS transporter